MASVPNFAQNYLVAYQAGRQLKQDRDRQNALAMAASDPAGAQNALIAAGDLQSASALGQMQDRQRAQQTRAAIAPMVQAGNYGGAVRQAAAGGDFDTAAAIGKLDDAQRKRAADNAEVIARAAFGLSQLPPEQRAAGLQKLAPILQQQGIGPDQLQNVDLSDQGLQAIASQALSVKDMVDNARADRAQAEAARHNQASEGLQHDRFAEERRHNRSTEANAAGQLGVARENARLRGVEVGQKGQVQPKDAQKAETSLRKEFDALPEVKNYRTQATAARTVANLASAPPSANNDIALIYSVMKAYDPTSVVRETEFATAQNAAGVPDKVRNAWNKALNGQRLNPQQRQEMARSVATVAETGRRRFEEIASQYRGYATDYGGNPDRVVPQNGQGAPAPQSQAPGGARIPLSQIFGR